MGVASAALTLFFYAQVFGVLSIGPVEPGDGWHAGRPIRQRGVARSHEG